MNISWETQHEQRPSWLVQNWISMDDDNPQVKQVGGNHQPGGVLNMVQELDRKKNMEFHYREVSASMGRWPTYVMRFMRKKTYIHHNGRIASCGHMSSNKMYNCVFPLPVLYLIFGPVLSIQRGIKAVLPQMTFLREDMKSRYPTAIAYKAWPQDRPRASKAMGREI